jgi:zinc transport system ATP-binding protein
MKMLEVRDLSVEIENRLILKNINFEVEKGDVLAIIGPNGAGKTTLLKAILGLIPYKGEIKYKNDDIKKHLDEISYIPQKFEFDKTIPLTVEEFLSLTLKKIDQNKKEHTIKEIGIWNTLNKKIGDLSGGELQRVLIAKAVLEEPELMLLDEPTTGIDIEGEKKFYELILHLNKDHKITIIFVSHEINIVYNFSNKVICLNKDLLCFGPTEKVLTERTIKSLYGEEAIYKLHEHNN